MFFCLPKNVSIRRICDSGSSISRSPFTTSNCSRENTSSQRCICRWYIEIANGRYASLTVPFGSIASSSKDLLTHSQWIMWEVKWNTKRQNRRNLVSSSFVWQTYHKWLVKHMLFRVVFYLRSFFLPNRETNKSLSVTRIRNAKLCKTEKSEKFK